MNDYRRPADYQVTNHYVCLSCGDEVSNESCYATPMLCHCGGKYGFSGESYPADSQDWHEERDNVNDDFHNRHDRY